MAYGDIGGAVTELMITCRAKGLITKGDPVWLTGHNNYEVESFTALTPNHAIEIFGEAMQSTEGTAIAIKVRGISRLPMMVKDNHINIGESVVLTCEGLRYAGLSRHNVVVAMYDDNTVEVLL